MRPEGTESTPPGAGPHQALHTPRHLTAVFRRGETCPEAGSKRVIHSDKAGALPLATGFPLETVQVRGQADPYTQRKCDGAPRRRVGKGWSWELGHTRCRGQARAESMADTGLKFLHRQFAASTPPTDFCNFHTANFKI